jgi:succinate-semialdehyde dehydrogenase/glutarate-semialdehyde dehydrogenase
VLADRRVRAATLTGSVGAGKAVARQAAAQVKPTVLELGGSDPFIVCADANLDAAASVGCTARMQNNGQSCIAAKRFIVEQAVADDFTERFIDQVESLEIGDPTDPHTDVGPMARKDLRDGVHDQVERAIGDGAVAAVGGHTLERGGFYYAPTVLTDVEPGTVAFEEEIFGPVASVVVADDAEHAVALANDTRFGLGGQRLYRGPREGRADGPRAGGGLRVRQRDDEERPPPPLRRHQGQRLRARALPPRHPGVREREDRVGRVGSVRCSRAPGTSHDLGA